MCAIINLIIFQLMATGANGVSLESAMLIVEVERSRGQDHVLIQDQRMEESPVQDLERSPRPATPSHV